MPQANAFPIASLYPVLQGFGFEFRISDFGIRVSGSGFQVSGFGFRSSGCRFRVSGFGVRAHLVASLQEADAPRASPPTRLVVGLMFSLISQNVLIK